MREFEVHVETVTTYRVKALNEADVRQMVTEVRTDLTPVDVAVYIGQVRELLP